MRIVARLLVLLPLLWVEGVRAVDCASTNYELSSQAEVDALGATGCDSVLGDLLIGVWGGSLTDITSLDGLINITSVGGYLSVANNDALTNLDGLVNIASVGGDLLIHSNAALTNLDGLANITSLEFLGISRNAALTNLDGLANITSVEGRLEIYDNYALTNLDGLANITSVEGILLIHNNDALTDVDGLANITSVSGVSIYDNAALTNLDALAKITSVEKGLNIHNNAALTNLDSLASLTSVGDYLTIANNDALTNLDGLANITSLEGSLGIHGNDALTDVDGLANITSVGDYLHISDNAALTDVDGLANITSVGDYLSIQYHAALTNLDGLANITSVGGDLSIDRNYRASCEGVAQLLGWPNGPPADTVGGNITVGRNGTGCDSVEQILASVSGPTQPVINQATASSTSITLGFTPSTTTDMLFPITGYSAVCTGSQADVSRSPATDLRDNTPVSETLTVTGYDPTSVLSSIEVDLDITHSDPTDLYITLTTPEGTELVLWNQGSSGGEDLVGTFPTTLTAVDSLNSVTRQTMDGDWVLSIEDIDVGPLVREGVLNSWGIRITEELARNGSGSPIEVFGATRGRDYTCTVAPVTKLGTTPVSDPYVVSVPLELPSVPTITSTDYEDGKIILTVSVTDNGGTDITGYEATCTDGTNAYTGTSTSSPITVSGLTNDVAYTCSVTATNSVGTSSASAATTPITPEATATGLPIWLLYQATQ